MPDKEQEFLDALDKKLWNAAQYKHAVLGLLFVKYVSNAFAIRRKELVEQFKNLDHEYFLDPENYNSTEAFLAEVEDELEIRDYYNEKNVFWVPQLGHWRTLCDNAALAPGTKIEIKNGKTHTYTFRGVGRLVDDTQADIKEAV